MKFSLRISHQIKIQHKTFFQMYLANSIQIVFSCFLPLYASQDDICCTTDTIL